MGAARLWLSSSKWRRIGFQLPIGRAREFQWYQDDHDVCLGPRPGRDPRGSGVYQLSIRHPDGATQQLDISEKNYRALKLQNMGKTLKKRGRKPGSNTKATKAASTHPRAVGARATSGRPQPDGQQLDGPDRLLSADAARPPG
jgi:hypothetical protein